jgi:hypothetical protein
VAGATWREFQATHIGFIRRTVVIRSSRRAENGAAGEASKEILMRRLFLFAAVGFPLMTGVSAAYANGPNPSPYDLIVWEEQNLGNAQALAERRAAAIVDETPPAPAAKRHVRRHSNQ